MEIISDSAEIDLIKFHKLDIPVRVEISKPFHGVIEPRQDGRKFIYKPLTGYFGTDTIPYRICGSNACRPGMIFVKVSPDPSVCYPVYSPADTHFVRFVSGPGRKSVPLFSGDVYCPENIRNLGSFSIIGLNNFTLSDSIRFSSAFSRTQKREFLISYSNTDQRLGKRIRYMHLTMQPDNAYCDAYFDVADRMFPVQLERDEFLLVSRSTFLNQVQACEQDLDDHFFELQSTPNLMILPMANESYKITFKPFSYPGPTFLTYRYRNQRGLVKEGTLKIIPH